MTNDTEANEILNFYNSFDLNKDGLIDYNEFDRLIKALGGKTSDEQRRAGFALVDTDKNGYIDFAEFSKWWGNN